MAFFFKNGTSSNKRIFAVFQSIGLCTNLNQKKDKKIIITVKFNSVFSYIVERMSELQNDKEIK